MTGLCSKVRPDCNIRIEPLQDQFKCPEFYFKF